MYKTILTQKALPFKKRIRRVMEYSVFRRSTRIQEGIRNKSYGKHNPDLIRPIEKSLEKAHQEYWKGFQRRVNRATLRISSNSSGVSDHKYIPEEIFRNDVEPTLNHTIAVEYLQFKSLYNRLFPAGLFPADYLHNMDGVWFDSDYNIISFDEVIQIAKGLDYPVVCKPNKDTGGGKGIVFPKNAAELVEAIQNKDNLLIQEKIVQHPYFNQFNPQGLNTIRVNMYRSVVDNKQHIISMALRYGVGGSLDNLSDGGIGAMINDDGYLGGYALNLPCDRYQTHPDTNLSFDQQLPDMDGLRKISIEVAQELFYTRLISLDICYDKEAKWRVIEVNLFSGSLRFPQYYGSPYFGEFTDEVRDYCLSHHWTLS